MTLTTHALVGAAAAGAVYAYMPDNAGLVWGCVAGFASHLAIDAIPHWDEGVAMLRSLQRDEKNHLNNDMQIGKDFALDILYLGSETLAGLLVSIFIFCVWLFHFPIAIIVLGACAGLFPDFLHFVYFKTRWSLLMQFERFHGWIQHQYHKPSLLLGEALLMVCVSMALKLLLPATG